MCVALNGGFRLEIKYNTNKIEYIRNKIPSFRII